MAAGKFSIVEAAVEHIQQGEGIKTSLDDTRALVASLTDGKGSRELSQALSKAGAGAKGMSPRLKALQEVEGLRLQMEYILSEMNDVEEQERAYAIEVVQAKIQRHRELEQTIAKAKEKCATEDQADVDRFQNHKDQMQGRRDQLRWLVNKSRADATRLHIARYAEAIMKQPEKTSGPWQKPGLPAGSPPAAKTAMAKPAAACEGSPHSHVKN